METITSTNKIQISSTNLYGVFAICFAGGVFGGVTSTLMSSYLPLAIKDLLGTASIAKNQQVSAIINAIFLFGMMAGGILLGILGDKNGRKLSVQLSIAFLGLFTLLTSFASTWELIAFCRFFTGFGVGGVLVTTTILIDEIWTEKNKAIALGILSITIPVGIFSAGIITYYFAEWRNGFIFGILPLLLAISGHWLIPESEKWRQNKLLKSSVKTNYKLFQKQTLPDLILGCIIYGAMLIGLWSIFSWLPTWIQSIVTTGNGNKEIGTGMMLFAIGGLSGGFASGWITNYFGMKKTMIICFAATFFFSFVLFKLNASITILSYIEMAGIALFFGISQGVLNVYIPELFPVNIRSSATGFCFNAGRVFTASVVFFVGWLVNFLNGYGNALFIFSFIFLIGLVATLFAKEKKLIHS